MAGRLSLVALLSMRLLDQGFEFLTCVERHYAPRGNGNLLAGLGIAAGPLGLVAKLEVPESRELDALTAFERKPDLFEERFHHVLRLALIEADLLEKHVRQLGFRQRHFLLPWRGKIALHFIT